MAEHHALGRPGRAPGVEQPGQVILGHPDAELDLGRVGEQRVVLAGVEADDVLDEGGEGPGVAVGDQDTGAGVDQGVAQLGLDVAGVEGHQHQPGGRDGLVELEVAVAVQRHDGHPVAALQAQLHEGAGEAAAALGGLLPGQSEVAADHRRTPAGRAPGPLQG